MNITTNKLSKLNSIEIIELLKNTLEEIYNNFKYLNLSIIEYYQIVTKEINKTKETYKGKKGYATYLKYQITNELIKIATKEENTTITLLNNYINKSQLNKDPINSLNKLSNIFSKIDENLNPNILTSLLNNNKIKKIINNFITYYQKNINTPLEEMFEDNILFLIDTYCYQNNITLEKQEKEISDETIDTSDIENYYFKEIQNIPLLTSKQEKELLIKAKQKDKSARDKLIESNQRLIIQIAKKFTSQAEFLDLIQEGNIALMKVIERFEPNKNYRFSTFAYCYIKGYIKRYIDNKSQNIRIPIYMQSKINEYQKIYANLKEQLNRDPTAEECAQKLDIPINEIKKIHLILKNSKTISLNIKLDENNKRELEEIISSTSVSFEEEILNNQLKKDIIKILSKCNLKERELKVIKMHFGFPPYDKPISYVTISKILNVSHQRVEQIAKRAIEKIQKSNQITTLAELSGKPPCSIKEINIQKERKKKMTNDKTIYSMLIDYGNKEEIDKVIESLSEHEKSIIYQRYNNNLNCKSLPKNIPAEVKKEFYQKIVPKIKRKLKNNKSIQDEKEHTSKQDTPVLPKQDTPVLPKQDTYTEILETIKTINFSEMLNVLSVKEAIIVSLRLGLIDNKYFTTEAIANFLNIDKEEVRNTTTKVLLLYKDFINKQIDETIKTLKK